MNAQQDEESREKTCRLSQHIEGLHIVPQREVVPAAWVKALLADRQARLELNASLPDLAILRLPPGALPN